MSFTEKSALLAGIIIYKHANFTLLFFWGNITVHGMFFGARIKMDILANQGNQFTRSHICF